MSNIVGLIAVRSGSKRVENKNLRPFADSSLLEIKLKQALNEPGLEKVYVSSDCHKMLSISEELGATPLERPSLLASDDIPMNQVYEYMAKELDESHICYLHVTSPMLSDITLSKCVKKYISEVVDSGRNDSLATVHKVQEYMWHKNSPVNYDPSNHPRSQDLPLYCALNFAVNIIPRKLMMTKKNIVGENFYPFFLGDEESVDVDTPHEFEIAEFLYQKKNAGPRSGRC